VRSRTSSSSDLVLQSFTPPSSSRAALRSSYSRERELNNNTTSEFDLEEQQNRQKHLDRANLKLQEEIDEVKRMNRMVNWAKATAIRDEQLEAKVKRKKR
jgi:hypothetical protein